LEELVIRIVGPLVDLEVRRAVKRSWVKILRSLVPVGAGLVLFLLMWTLWMMTGQHPDQVSPVPILEYGLDTLMGFMVTGAWLLIPALLAGAFSGERPQAGLLLLLTCQVSARDIVLGRLLGRLAICAVFMLAALPAVTLLAGLCDLRFVDIGLMMLLPLAVGFGAGGICCAASVVSRRGRDALLAVYLIYALILLAPVFTKVLLAPLFTGLSLTRFEQWVGALNPYYAIDPLVTGAGQLDGLVTIGLWLAIGLVGVAFTACRLRPSVTRSMNVGVKNRRGKGRRRVPGVSSRPMLWKEMHIEQLRTVNRIARMLVIVLVVLYLFGHIAFGGSLIVERIAKVFLTAGSTGWLHNSAYGNAWQMSSVRYETYARITNHMMAWLLELAVGLRAASTIASERERNTWDSILTSPIEGGEIVYAKLAGSLYGLRFLFFALIIGWALPIAAGIVGSHPGFTGITVAGAIGGTAAVCVFMASLGLWMSLTSATATRAMSWTVAGWIIAQTVVNLAASVLGLMLSLVIGYAITFWLPGYNSTYSPYGFGFSPMMIETITMIIHVACFLFLSFGIWLFCRRRFDFLAGRTFAPAIPSAGAHGPRRIMQYRPVQRPPEQDTVAVEEPNPVDQAHLP
jgi:ABC-type transport system involved in multi-copper enzyme maturation permease subunit